MERLSKEIKELHQSKQKKNTVVIQSQSQAKPQLQKKKSLMPMTFAEKKTLGENIRILPAEYLRGVWEIVS